LASHVPEHTHVAMLIDNADEYATADLTVPVSLIVVNPPPCSPERDANEKVGQYLRDRWNRSSRRRARITSPGLADLERAGLY